jgi:hypothetical protein
MRGILGLGRLRSRIFLFFVDWGCCVGSGVRRGCERGWAGFMVFRFMNLRMSRSEDREDPVQYAGAGRSHRTGLVAKCSRSSAG